MINVKRNDLDDDITELFSDERFLNIQKVIREPNIFSILSNTTYETRHSNFIAWLLDSNETHNAGTLFSSRIIPLLASTAENRSLPWLVFREKYHIDLLLVSGDETIVIENKTFSKDSPGQLSRYRKIIENKYSDSKKSFVYLTLHGEKPVDINEAENWSLCSYSDILKELKSILHLHSHCIHDKAQFYIKDYISAVEIYATKNNIINNDSKEIVAESKDKLMKIFNSFSSNANINIEQRKTLDFIKNNSSFVKGAGFFKQDHIFYSAFKNILEKYDFEVPDLAGNSTTYLRFINKSLIELASTSEIPFQMSFRFDEKQSTLRFMFGILPETDQNVILRKRLIANISKIKKEFGVNAVQGKGNHHIGLFIKKISFNPLSCDADNILSVVEHLIKTEVLSHSKNIVNTIKRSLSV